METFLKQIKFIDQNERDLINGYVHESQSLLPTDNHYFIIPSLVIYTILYYFYDPERFDECDECIKLNEERTIATQTSHDGHYISIYGTRKIPPDAKCIYEWKFRAMNIQNPDHQLIGIHSFTNYEKLIHRDCTVNAAHWPKDGSSSFWAITDEGSRWTNHDENECENYQCMWGDGDTVTMRLDTEKKTLSYRENDYEFGVVFENMKLHEETYMMVTIGKQELGIELLSFSCTNTVNALNEIHDLLHTFT